MTNIDLKIEQTILASFLYNEMYLNEKLFKLDDKYFVLPFHKAVVKSINERRDNGTSLLILIDKLSAWCRDVKPEFQDSFLGIITQTPVSIGVAKQYYSDIKVKGNM